MQGINASQELTVLLSDGYRTALDFFDAIKDSAAQIYFSALPLMPQGSPLLQCYQHEAPNSINILHGKQQSWSPCLRLIDKYTSGIRSVAFSPDGTSFVSWSDDTVIRLWDAKTGELRMVVGEHRGGANCVAFLPDGDIASASADEDVKVWDSETGQLRLSMEGCLARVFSTSDLHIALINTPNIEIFDASNGSLLKTVPDGHTLPHAGLYPMKHILPVWDDQRSKHLKYASFNLNAVSRDGRRAASLSSANAMRIWDTETGKLFKSWSPSGCFECLVFSPDGIHLAASGDQVHIWNSTTGELEVVLPR